MNIYIIALSATILIILIIGAVAWGPIVSNNVEKSKYSVIDSSGDIQIRSYAPMIVAEVEVAGEREQAISQGFRVLADYIFGGNLTNSELAMTAPVAQQSTTKIAMTAPVTQAAANGKWQVRFMMPSKYDMQSLPKPNNDAVKLEQIPIKKYAVITFSGIANDNLLAKKLEELQTYIQSQNIKTNSVPIYAFFNPPWTLPFLRRNEIMLEIK